MWVATSVCRAAFGGGAPQTRARAGRLYGQRVFSGSRTLMYKKLIPLQPTQGGGLRLLPLKDYSFARGELLAPIVVDEVAKVAREYPIVFPMGNALPAALLGVEKDSNAYVGSHGQWLATYIPAHIRAYPLAIVRVPAEGDAMVNPGETSSASGSVTTPRFALLVDEAAACVSPSAGDPILDNTGQPTGLAQQKLQLLAQLRARAGVTGRIVKAIDDAGLLKERAIRVRRAGQPDRDVTGVRVIDEPAVNKLDDASFNKLRAAGALPLLYAALLSWANFREGPIGRAHPLPAVPALPADDVIRFG
jgi:hypothetical protein